jgi:hypothetical protein
MQKLVLIYLSRRDNSSDHAHIRETAVLFEVAVKRNW